MNSSVLQNPGKSSSLLTECVRHDVRVQEKYTVKFLPHFCKHNQNKRFADSSTRVMWKNQKSPKIKSWHPL